MEDNNQDRHSGENWLVSFGDLLTLLLCFFLSVLSAGPLNPHNSTSSEDLNGRNNEGSNDDYSSVHRLNETGIQLAQLTDMVASAPIESEDGLIVLTTQDFATSSQDVLAAAQNLIRNVLNKGIYKESKIKIHACSDVQLDDSEDSYYKAAKRAHNIRRQLIDSTELSGRTELLVRNVGPHCDLLATADRINEVAVVIEFGTKHG